MRSTKPGIPWSVAAIRPSSSCAGTTTATRFPSSMTRSYGADRLGGLASGADAPVAQNRHDRADQQPDQRTDHDRRPLRVRRREDGGGRRDDLRALDVLGERELLLRRRLLVEQVALALLCVVDLTDQHELVERRQVRLRNRLLER